MKILTANQISEADRRTIENEPIESINLMERASEVIAQWICTNIPTEIPLCFLIGKGNNGGDGLAVARMLYNVGYECTVYTAFGKKELGEECRFNLERLPRGLKSQGIDKIDNIAEGTIIIDALLGSGVKGMVSEQLKVVIDLINSLECTVISIDMPSGMLTEYGNANQTIVKATTTLTLEYPKLAMMLPEAGECCGNIIVLPIDLDSEYIESVDSSYTFVDEEFAAGLLIARAKFAHKGDYGHLLLACGSEGMAGAAVLSTGAALRSGCGLVTVHTPQSIANVIYTTNPSAMISIDKQPFISTLPDGMDKFTIIGVGCGVGQNDASVAAIDALLKCGKPMVIDADALNIIAQHTYLQEFIPAGSVLTPHLGELRRLIGDWIDDKDRNQRVIDMAIKLKSCIVVKGAHTMICTNEGEMLFNSTGNPGMAKCGSGDVLAGYISGLYARGYAPAVASVLGVYIHGKAGDKAAEYFGTEGMNSSDMIDFLGETMNELGANTAPAAPIAN